MVHKHTIAKEQTHAWAQCVTPEACAAKPERQRAHGAVIHTQECKCGATRAIESNQRWSNKTIWQHSNAERVKIDGDSREIDCSIRGKTDYLDN